MIQVVRLKTPNNSESTNQNKTSKSSDFFQTEQNKKKIKLAKL